FRKLCSAKHSVVSNENRRIHLRVSMLLACVQIEHELAEGALEPRQTLLQYDKARARQFRGKLEIHLFERFAQIEVLFRLECVVTLFAEHMMLDIAAGVGAIRHFVERRVGDLREFLVERSGQSFLLFLHRGQQGFELGDFGHQLACLGLILCLLRVADFLRRRVAASLRLLKFCDGRSALFVERHELFRQRLQPAPFQAAVEGVRMLANPLDVVHGGASLSGYKEYKNKAPSTTPQKRTNSILPALRWLKPLPMPLSPQPQPAPFSRPYAPT